MEYQEGLFELPTVPRREKKFLWRIKVGGEVYAPLATTKRKALAEVGRMMMGMGGCGEEYRYRKVLGLGARVLSKTPVS